MGFLEFHLQPELWATGHGRRLAVLVGSSRPALLGSPLGAWDARSPGPRRSEEPQHAGPPALPPPPRLRFVRRTAAPCAFVGGPRAVAAALSGLLAGAWRVLPLAVSGPPRGTDPEGVSGRPGTTSAERLVFSGLFAFRQPQGEPPSRVTPAMPTPPVACFCADGP